MNASEIMQRLTPERRACVESLIEQTRIARSRPKPMPVPSIVHGYGRYASPVLRGRPTMLLIDSETATKVLRSCKMYPRQSPIDEEKLQNFIELIQAGTWEADKSQPIMISARGIILNGRHRLTALSRSGGEATMPVLDELGILTKN